MISREIIERTERLVHQDDLRLETQGAAERNPLGHAAAQLGRVGVAKGFQAELAQRRQRNGFHGVRRQRPIQGKCHVFKDAQPGHQAGFLKHKADFGRGGGVVAAGPEDLSGGCLFQAAQQAQQGGFAAAALADDDGEAAVGDRGRGVVHGIHGPVADAELFGKIADFNPGHNRFPLLPSRGRVFLPGERRPSRSRFP